MIDGSGLATEPAGLDSRSFDGTDGALAGPHFTLRLSWVATGQQIKANDPGSVTPKGMRAGEGQEFVVFGANPDFRNGQWKTGDKPKPVAELVVGGKATALKKLPLPTVQANDLSGALVIASVPSGSEVLLRITDEGQAQTLDLRTGKRRDDAIAVYYRKHTKKVDLNKEVPAGIKAESTQYQFKFRLSFSAAGSPSSNAMLAPYTPGQGWAAKGRVWLVLPSPSPSTYQERGAPIVALDADDPAVFRLKLADGSQIKALAGKHHYETTVGSVAKRGADIVFDVPADFTTGTFLMDLGAAAITAKYSDATRPGTWSPAPPVTEIAVSFA